MPNHVNSDLEGFDCNQRNACDFQRFCDSRVLKAAASASELVHEVFVNQYVVIKQVVLKHNAREKIDCIGWIRTRSEPCNIYCTLEKQKEFGEIDW